jgi:hypothetical protein
MVAKGMLRRPLISALYHAPQKAAHFNFSNKGSRHTNSVEVSFSIKLATQRQEAKLTGGKALIGPFRTARMLLDGPIVGLTLIIS